MTFLNNSMQRVRDHLKRVIVMCASDQLKKRKFNNHFNQLLQW